MRGRRRRTAPPPTSPNSSLSPLPLHPLASTSRSQPLSGRVYLPPSAATSQTELTPPPPSRCHHLPTGADAASNPKIGPLFCGDVLIASSNSKLLRCYSPRNMQALDITTT